MRTLVEVVADFVCPWCFIVAGRAVGIELRHDLMKRVPDTSKAHRRPLAEVRGLEQRVSSHGVTTVPSCVLNRAGSAIQGLDSLISSIH